MNASTAYLFVSIHFDDCLKRSMENFVWKSLFMLDNKIWKVLFTMCELDFTECG